MPNDLLMPQAYTSFFSMLEFKQAYLPAGTQFLLFSIFSTAAALLLIYLVVIRRSPLMGMWGQNLRNFVADLRGTKFEARLDKVVCYHCNKGMGLYNPIYFDMHGEPHIEGTCSHCGGFVRVRMR